MFVLNFACLRIQYCLNSVGRRHVMTVFLLKRCPAGLGSSTGFELNSSLPTHRSRNGCVCHLVTLSVVQSVVSMVFRRVSVKWTKYFLQKESNPFVDIP